MLRLLSRISLILKARRNWKKILFSLSALTFLTALETQGEVAQPLFGASDIPAPNVFAQDIVEFQRNRTSQKREVDFANEKITIELIDLNPTIRLWYLLTIARPNKKITSYHLEAVTRQLRLSFDPDFKEGLVVSHEQNLVHCDLWSAPDESETVLAKAAATSAPYVSLCDGMLYLRNKIKGHRTTKEWVTELLRDRVYQGEAITNLVKEAFYKDRYQITAESLGIGPTPATRESTAEGARKIAFNITDNGLKQTVHADITGGSSMVTEATRQANAERMDNNLPMAGRIAIESANQALQPRYLGINREDNKAPMIAGQWYKSKLNRHAFVSVVKASIIDKSILTSYRDRVSALETQEAENLNLLVAFDLSELELGYSVGTDHPRVDWSPRAGNAARQGSMPPGPDGFATASPLITTGALNPKDAQRAVATFAGGFKRYHSAFKFGPYAVTNRANHYGFIENGVVFSTMRLGLATLAITDQGEVRMKTWSDEDDKDLANIRYARQNGVAIIEGFDVEANKSIPGIHVNNWMAGNWSGDAKGALRALRGGICLQKNEGRDYLIFAYFSSATPSTMARVFQAYNCHYAFLLDMNSPEYTYLAIYPETPGRSSLAEHLTTGMPRYDEHDGQKVARFRDFPDNRDFFFLLRKETTTGGL